jgi:PAS domain S-box-containing protein
MPRHSDANSCEPTLRQQAEGVLQNISQETANVPEADLQRLVHELQVHQVELELQNTELRRSQEALQMARDQYAALYDLAPVGYVTLDAQGTIVAANVTAATMLGVSRHTLPGTPLSRFVARHDQDMWYFHRRQVREGAGLSTCDLTMQRPDGATWVAYLLKSDG